MIKHIHVFDMDGVLVCSLHRYRTMPCNTRIDLQYWLDNEHKAGLDSLLPMAEKYKQLLKDPESYVIIATARVINEPDLKFIKEVLGMPNKLISRRDRNDWRSGVELKAKPLKQLFSLRQFKNATKTYYEDNIAYLKGVSEYVGNMNTVYIPSKQGH